MDTLTTEGWIIPLGEYWMDISNGKLQFYGKPIVVQMCTGDDRNYVTR